MDEKITVTAVRGKSGPEAEKRLGEILGLLLELAELGKSPKKGPANDCGESHPDERAVRGDHR